MGLIRKAMSVSTLGVVKYKSDREVLNKAVTKRALAEARLADAQADAVQGKPAEGEGPWWQQPTIGQMIQARRRRA